MPNNFSNLTWCFHVFTNDVDIYTSNLMKALLLFMQYAQDVGTARLTLEVDGADGTEFICDNLLAIGPFPV